MTELTPYDEFPVHQYSRPFSEMPVSDFNWDDGYYFGVYSADEGVFLYTGLRVTPNADVVGCYGGVSVGGHQTTFRASRVWRPDYDTAIGPYRIRVVEPFREIHLALEPNDSGVAFDLRWLALAPAHVEAHHFARTRGRITTDQTRYTQGGTAEGWIEVGGRRFEVRPHAWYADRDHSWGLYEPRAPLSDPKEWLPPAEERAKRRMLRFWMPFQSRDLSGFFHFHEDEHGKAADPNDPFGTPFEGAIDFGFDGDRPRLRLVEGSRELRFQPGTRVLAGGDLVFEDEHGATWKQSFESASMPWTTFPIGYYLGTWRDGGNIHTYHGNDPVHTEWDVIDFSQQPASHTTYDGRSYSGIHGAEYPVRVTTEGPHGVSTGMGHIEFFMHRSYKRYQPDDGVYRNASG